MQVCIWLVVLNLKVELLWTYHTAEYFSRENLCSFGNLCKIHQIFIHHLLLAFKNSYWLGLNLSKFFFHTPKFPLYGSHFVVPINFISLNLFFNVHCISLLFCSLQVMPTIPVLCLILLISLASIANATICISNEDCHYGTDLCYIDCSQVAIKRFNLPASHGNCGLLFKLGSSATRHMCYIGECETTQCYPVIPVGLVGCCCTEDLCNDERPTPPGNYSVVLVAFHYRETLVWIAKFCALLPNYL